MGLQKLTSQKWVALGLLLLGCALSQLKWGNIGELVNSSTLGYILVTAQCSISATVSVVLRNST